MPIITCNPPFLPDVGDDLPPSRSVQFYCATYGVDCRCSTTYCICITIICDPSHLLCFPVRHSIQSVFCFDKAYSQSSSHSSTLLASYNTMATSGLFLSTVDFLSPLFLRGIYSLLCARTVPLVYSFKRVLFLRPGFTLLFHAAYSPFLPLFVQPTVEGTLCLGRSLT